MSISRSMCAPRTILWDASGRFVKERGENSFETTYYRPQIQAALDEKSQTLLEEIEAGRDSSPEAQTAKREIGQLYVLAPGLRGSLRDAGSLVGAIWCSPSRSSRFVLVRPKLPPLSTTRLGQ